MSHMKDLSIDELNEFKVIEERNNKLVLENRKMKEEINRLRLEKQLMFKDLLKMKNDIENHFDYIGKTYFSDNFYEE